MVSYGYDNKEMDFAGGGGVYYTYFGYGYAFSENWYEVGYVSLKYRYKKVWYTFWKNWFKKNGMFLKSR